MNKEHSVLTVVSVNTMQRLGCCVYCGLPITNFDEAFRHYYENSPKRSRMPQVEKRGMVTAEERAKVAENRSWHGRI